jgi:DNA (cytosine-5)-methyltransferase 1
MSIDKLRCVDLFSGTGGLGLALRDFVTVVQYCEINPYCQQVLTERMESDDIDRASIHGDVRTMHVTPCLAPEMLCGGFPCQDISSIGLQRGIANGEQSGMFFEMMRIVDECPTIKTIFLENVSNIVRCGLSDVIEQCTKRGFDMQWTMRSAAAQGAPHQRQRWFCLAVKRGVTIDVPAVKLEDGWWDVEPCPRVVLRPRADEIRDPDFDQHWIQRCQCLGNAVVPSVARAAFAELTSAHKNWSHIASCLSDYGVDVDTLDYPFPETGLIVNGYMFGIPKKKAVDVKHNVEISLVLPNNTTMRIGNYPTPRRGITHPSSLSDRSIRDLPTVLVNCEETRKYLQEERNIELPSALVLPNVKYIEWMMGYKPDWTRIKTDISKHSKNATNYVTSADSNTTSESITYIEDVDDDSNPKKSTRQKTHEPLKKRLNGMHMLMREHAGKGVSVVAQLWRALTEEQRATYTATAKQLSM